MQSPAAVVPGLEVPLQLLQQGGLFAVLLVVLYFYRRDYRRLIAENEILIALVERTTTALNENTATSKRIARAVEHMNNRRRATDALPARGPEPVSAIVSDDD